MCRTGGRQCRNCGGRTPAERRNNARIRKQRSVAGKALRTALNQGALIAARAAELTLREIEGGDATADKILNGLSYPYGLSEVAAETPEPAAPAVQIEAPETRSSEAMSPMSEQEELVQTKTGSPARIDAWLTELQRQGHKIVSTSETQAGRSLRVTAKYIKIPSAPRGPAVHH